MSARHRLLIGIERGLVAVGTVLAVWCAFVILQARYYASLPIPAARTLPGESPTSGPRRPDAGVWLARLEAPSVDLSATVLEGSDDETLQKAAGHIEDTALPGERGNIGIAGHRDTTFRPVRKLRVGDPLVLMTSDRVYRYRVTRTQIVAPEDIQVLAATGHPTITLVTCYPFEFIGHAPKRYVVTGELVGEDVRSGGP
jgi:sortase A